MKKQSFGLISAILIVVFLVFFSGCPYPTAAASIRSAAAVVLPAVTSISPTSALNDVDTPVIITGSGFFVDLTDPANPVQPTAYLGSAALLNVTWVDANILTASVPWGMERGVYPLTVTNPDGGTGSLVGAFTVQSGIGQWNTGGIYGGQVDNILMKPGDPATLYADANGAGLFRSQDAGENWTFVSNFIEQRIRY